MVRQTSLRPLFHRALHKASLFIYLHNQHTTTIPVQHRQIRPGVLCVPIRVFYAFITSQRRLLRNANKYVPKTKIQVITGLSRFFKAMLFIQDLLIPVSYTPGGPQVCACFLDIDSAHALLAALHHALCCECSPKQSRGAGHRCSISETPSKRPLLFGYIHGGIL